jgi:uncharacterized lipoprotein YmbA
MRPVVIALVALLLAACGSSPPTRFYALDAPGSGAGARELPGPSIAIGPVTVPEAVDRAQVVTRRGANEVRIEEFSQWAAPLNAEITRVVAEQLALLRPDARIAPSAAAPALPDYRVAIDVRRFELTPGEGAALDATWTVWADGKALRSARAAFVEAATDPSIEALVAAQSRSAARLARDIAAALPAR